MNRRTTVNYIRCDSISIFDNVSITFLNDIKKILIHSRDIYTNIKINKKKNCVYSFWSSTSCGTERRNRNSSDNGRYITAAAPFKCTFASIIMIPSLGEPKSSKYSVRDKSDPTGTISRLRKRWSQNYHAQCTFTLEGKLRNGKYTFFDSLFCFSDEPK